MRQRQMREKLARRLRELMDANDSLNTQVKVAKRAGVAQASVQRILAREQSATIDMLEMLAHAFGVVHPEYFLLDTQDIQLLQQWSGLSLEDKEAVLGFIGVRAVLRKSPGGDALNFHSKRLISGNLVAATNKASARPVIPTAESDVVPAKKKNVPARSSKNPQSR